MMMKIQCRQITSVAVIGLVVLVLQWGFGHDPVALSASHHHHTAALHNDFGTLDAVALAVDTLTSWLLLDASVVLLALAVIVGLLLLGVVAAATLFSLHGYPLQAIRTVWADSRWMVALLTLSMCVFACLLDHWWLLAQLDFIMPCVTNKPSYACTHARTCALTQNLLRATHPSTSGYCESIR